MAEVVQPEWRARVSIPQDREQPLRGSAWHERLVGVIAKSPGDMKEFCKVPSLVADWLETLGVAISQDASRSLKSLSVTTSVMKNGIAIFQTPSDLYKSVGKLYNAALNVRVKTILVTTSEIALAVSGFIETVDKEKMFVVAKDLLALAKTVSNVALMVFFFNAACEEVVNLGVHWGDRDVALMFIDTLKIAKAIAYLAFGIIGTYSLTVSRITVLGLTTLAVGCSLTEKLYVAVCDPRGEYARSDVIVNVRRLIPPRSDQESLVGQALQESMPHAAAQVSLERQRRLALRDSEQVA